VLWCCRLRVLHAGCSERGPRANNQDCFFCDSALGLFAIADGMGGHNAGEVASAMAVETLVGFVKATAGTREVTWPFPFDDQLSVAANRLLAGLRLANQKVHDAGRTDAQLANMGTTIVAAFVDGERVVIAHVGDSRAYRFRDGRLEPMTRDHTWVAAMLAAEPNARTDDHPMRHVLTSGIGMREDVKPTVTEHDVAVGESWLLCSDGVHGYVDSSELARALSLSSPELVAGAAVRAALDSGGGDNATAVVLRFV
jgi:serine/threonine protein phosphatase PrpC